MRNGRKDGGAEGLGEAPDVWADEVEATMLAARALVAISARSVAAVEDVDTPPRLRVMVMVASRGPLNLGAVARGLGVHPSNATRASDRLVTAADEHLWSIGRTTPVP